MSTTQPAKPLTLRERNAKVLHKALLAGDEVKELREYMKKRWGCDPITDTEKFPLMEGRFSWRNLKHQLRESDASSAFTQFLRAGVSQIMIGAYEAVAPSFHDWVTVVPSKLDTELYAPNHGVAFPRQVGPMENYPEVGSLSLDLKLQNLKYGSVYSIQKELLNDDQTGSFANQQAQKGEYLALLSEVLVMGKLASVANMQYIDYAIPVSETKPAYEANYPWSQAFRGGGANRPAAYATMNQANIQAAIVALHNQKNLQGIKMQVNPKRLLIGPTKEFDAKVLMHSTLNASGAAAAGGVGGAYAINPIENYLQITMSRFMFKQDGTVNGDSTAWYVLDDGKPFFVQQMREPVSVVQEDPNSGESFNKDLFRFKASTRMNADFVDPRFIFQGSDGSF
jgi:hypothetical protein